MITVNETEPVKHVMPLMPQSKYRHYRLCLDIKDRYSDGMPLNSEDKKVILDALRMHPKGKDKFGPGIDDVIVDTFIFGKRCYFAIRSDGTAVDFSVYKCFGKPANPHKGKIAMVMDKFNYSRVVMKYRHVRMLRRSVVN